jgi:D-alanyl-lipoteichoic acid acyltransferase DltB (MBOAT superfamily)
VTAVIYHLLPRLAVTARRIFLIAVSGTFVMLLSKLTLVFLLSYAAMSVLSIYWAAGSSRLRAWDKPFFWTLRGVATLLTAVAFLYAEDLTTLGDQVLLFGAGYAYLKTLWVIGWAEKNKSEGLSWYDPILSNLFFPIVASGPIERPDAFTSEKLGCQISLQDVVEGVGRMALGLAYILVFQNAVSKLMAIDTMPVYILPPLSLLLLYLNFAGYTHVALGAGRLFGLRLTENFNRPWLARDLPDFWRRWHISLMNFANENIYFPLFKRAKGKVAIPILVTFLFVGLWHGLTLSFFFWGVAHGVGLLGSMRITAWIGRDFSGAPAAIARFLNRVACLYYASLVWYFSAYVIAF